MQNPRVARALEKLCTSPVMWEDLVLLSANPFDPVVPGDLVAPGEFEECGLIEPSGDGWVVNLDLALVYAPSAPLEFGFAATLLARLDPSALQRVARSAEIGPRPSPVDYVLDIAEACTDPQRIMRQLAFLRESDREPLRAALAAGELPAEIDGIAQDTDRPIVGVDPGEAGARGLLFRVAQQTRGVPDRGVVALELQSKLPEWLDLVPPPPEAVAAKPAAARKPRAASGTSGVSRSRAAASPDKLSPAPMTPDPVSVYDDRPAMPMRRSEERRVVSASSESRGIRAAHVQAVGGVVDLESPRLAELAQRDPELGESVLSVVASNLVVLKPGVDVRDWVERCVARVGFG